MALTVVTRASSFGLTTKGRIKLEVSTIPASVDDALLDELIDGATAAVQSFCNRTKVPFARQAYQETLGAYGDTSLMLKGTPIVSVTSLLLDGAAITDYTIEDAEAGILDRRIGFGWTAQRGGGFAGRQSFPMYGSPIAGSEEKRYTADYVSGFLMPGQDQIGKTTISAASADNSFNDSASGFPALLKAGDFIVTSGFANPANNGTFTVTGTPTAAKIPVTATLTVEAAGPVVSVIVRNLPADLERAAVECVKAWWAARSDDPNVIEKHVGPMGLRFGEEGGRAFLPPTCVGLLRAWARAA